MNYDLELGWKERKVESIKEIVLLYQHTNRGLDISGQDVITETRYTLTTKISKIYEMTVFKTLARRQLRTKIWLQIQEPNEESPMTAPIHCLEFLGYSARRRNWNRIRQTPWVEAEFRVWRGQQLEVTGQKITQNKYPRDLKRVPLRMQQRWMLK